MSDDFACVLIPLVTASLWAVAFAAYQCGRMVEMVERLHGDPTSKPKGDRP